MSRNNWIVLGLVAALVVAWLLYQNQRITPRVPVSSGAAGGGAGLLDSINQTVSKLTGIFRSIGGSSSGAAAPGDSNTLPGSPEYGPI